MNLRTLSEIPEYRARNLHGKRELVEWNGLTSQAYDPHALLSAIARLGVYISGFGLPAGSRVAIFSDRTRFLALAAEFALLDNGHTICPIHTFLAESEIKEALALIDPDAIIVPDGQHADRIGHLTDAQVIRLDLLEENAPATGTSATPSRPDDPAFIILTSGTTGRLKGVVLTHKNLLSNVIAVMAVVPIDSRHTTLSFLPISHIFERIVLYVCLALGASVHFSSPGQPLRVILKKVSPHFFTAVPHNLETVLGKYFGAVERENYIRRQIFNRGLKMAQKKNRFARMLARQIAFRKLKRQFGSRIQCIIVGGAAMDPEVMKWYETAGIRVREGYGLTEAGGVVTFNRFRSEYRIGTAGAPIPGIEVSIAKDQNGETGEVMVRGPSVMRGYFRAVEGESSPIDAHGWLHTGDIGCLVQQRFLKITGRAKEIFKTAHGEYINPVAIEAKLKEDIAVKDAVLTGFRRTFPAALILPDFDHLESWCADRGVHWTAPAYMIHNPEVQGLFEKVVADVNDSLSPYEQIGGYALLSEGLDGTAELYSVTGKLRRHKIEEQFGKVIDDIYRRRHT